MSDLEDDFNPRSHNTLLQAIGGLKKNQHIRQTTRNEPKLKQDEFELFKGTSIVTTEHVDADAVPTTAVAVNDLVQVLRKKKKHIDAGKLLKNVQRTKKVLQKPLEKPAAERIKRQVGYDKVKAKLQRWDAVVAKNRVAEQQVFPLPSETVYINTEGHRQPIQHTIKSDLRREMEAAEEKLRQLKRERDGDFENEADLEKKRNELHQIKLTRQELIARRKELAYLRTRESQQSAKARMRNKIKSKKYHKLLRRQKLQAQLKEFEQLQKSNPEAALEKLEELEKSRVVERATLRHKNTGAWAKNLQVRAKYDKDVRKDLSEQLKISRELTQKSKNFNDDDDGDNNSIKNEMDLDEANDEAINDLQNPWLKVSSNKGKATDKNEKEKGENWRKYWMDRNRNEKLLAAYKAELVAAMNEEEIKMENDENMEIESKPKSVVENKKPNKAKSVKKERMKSRYENGWLVEELESSSNTTEANSQQDLPEIDDLFDAVEESMQNKIQQKLNKLRSEAKNLSQKPKKLKKQSKRDALKNLKDLSFKQNAKRPEIDEELGENNEEVKSNVSKANGVNVTVEENNENEDNVKTKKSSSDDFIDPTNIFNVTPKKIHKQGTLAATEIEYIDGDEEGEDYGDGNEDDFNANFNANHLTISEAFEDDDIVVDFSQEKSKDAELKNTEIDLGMPGWGSWAGAGMNSMEREEKSKKRLVLKLAPEERRRDENKGDLYINEETTKQVRPHLVSDLPFPFTSLQDYEASIRAPIGRNFVPETAFRMLTRPAVITRKGTIIEPMDESELTKKPIKSRSIVDKRINETAKLKEKKLPALVK